MIRKTIMFAAMAAMALPGSAWAAHCASLTASPSTPSIPPWNPLNGQPQEASFTVKLSREQGGAKNARLIFNDANSNALPTRIGSTSGPRYEIRDAAGNLLSFPQNAQVSAA